jgi:hypothetical protein
VQCAVDTTRRQVNVSSSEVWEQTHFFEIFLVGVCVTGVNHDRIEGCSSFRKSQGSVDVFLGRRMIKMNSDGNRSGMGEVDAEREEWLAAPI